jgi:predicted metal-dependent phosphoesterase TrpH
MRTARALLRLFAAATPVTFEEMLRGDFHHHIDADPVDGRFIRHSAGALIDHAAGAGLHVLAITCHESIPYDGDATRYAARRGVLLLHGMEATVSGHHVLLLNFREWPAGECSMADIEALKTPEALVIAPHPFYPAGIAGGETLQAHRRVFDAVEFSGLYTPLTQRFNRRAQRYAQTADLPVVGNSDTHFLWQLGYTYTLIDAPPEPQAVIEAIRRGRVHLVTRPLSWLQVARFIVDSHSTRNLLRDGLQYMAKILRRTKSAPRQPVPLGSTPWSRQAP